MKLQNVASRVAAVALLLPLGVLVSCSAERAGTLITQKPPVTATTIGATTTTIAVTIGACAPAAGVTVVTWTGVSTRSVRVEYRNSSGQAAQTSWKNLAKAVASGSANVTAPAAALAGPWSVWAVTLAPESNGGGTGLLTRPFNDCAIVTTQTMPPETAAPTTSVK